MDEQRASVRRLETGALTARSVSAELEAIFAAAGAPVCAESGVRRGAVGPRAAAARGGVSVAGLGMILAAGLVGLSIGASVKGAPPPSPQLRPAASPTPAPAPAPAPTAVAPARVAVAPVITDAPLIEAAVASPAPAPVTAAIEPAAPAPAAAPAKRPRAKAAARPPRTLAKARASACPRPCTYQHVLAADRSLRRAYDRATDAGVSRTVLVDYRQRWSRLRPRARYEPAVVVSGYGAMARDLQRLADRADGGRRD